MMNPWNLRGCDLVRLDLLGLYSGSSVSENHGGIGSYQVGSLVLRSLVLRPVDLTTRLCASWEDPGPDPWYDSWRVVCPALAISMMLFMASAVGVLVK